MFEIACNEKKALSELECKLEEIKGFLSGNCPCEKKEAVENCFLDTMLNNFETVNRCLVLAEQILKVTKGDK